MNRRDSILALPGLAAMAVSFPAYAQAPRRIGVIHTRGGSMNRDQSGGKLFVEAMKELGYEENRHYLFDDRRWGKPDEVPGLAREADPYDSMREVRTGPGAPPDRSLSLNQLERAAVREALNRSAGNRRKAADYLGISERTLYRKIKEYGLA